MQALDWKTAFTAWTNSYEPWAVWGESRECHAMRAEANGKVAAEYAETQLVGMAAGYARIAAHHAYIAYPSLREQ